MRKFCLRTTLGLKNTLKKLGITDAFTYQADFSKIDGLKDLFLHDVLHAAFIGFDEHGLSTLCKPENTDKLETPPRVEPATNFHATRPILFMILDERSKTILFIGQIHDPSKEPCHES